MAKQFVYGEYLASREWAVLKEAVRKRSGDMCERNRPVHQAPYQSTHHLTYERIGHELLTDLQAVCTPCHEYLSGKRDDDPSLIVAVPVSPQIRRQPILNKQGTRARVYLAGKIGKNDWRHDLFPELRNIIRSNDVDEMDGWKSSWFNHDAPIIDLDNLTLLSSFSGFPEADGLLYGGPFFVGCDHGCLHGTGTHGQTSVGTHGGMCSGGMSRSRVPESCLGLLKDSDYVFCWLDSFDAYGSLFELGFAHALGKPIFLAMPQNLPSDDFWFTQYCVDYPNARGYPPPEGGGYCSSGGYRQFQDHRTAWNQFVSAIREPALT